jgi:exonuclease SbcD
MATPAALSDSPPSDAPATLRLLHTSDLQLDAPFAFLGEKGAGHRKQVRATFKRILELAREGKYDILLIAGDLFNDNRPSRSSLGMVQDGFAALPLPVCILPGNHDCYDRNSVYRREVFPANVHILTETPSVVDFPDLNLVVTGNAVLSRQSTAGSLRGIARRAERRWNVAMAHGNVCIPGLVQDPLRPIQPGEIASCPVDYIALGDWHAFVSHSQSPVTAFYCGAPEPMSLAASGSGYVASVTLSSEGLERVQVQPVRVGGIEADRLSVDVTGRSEREIVSLMNQRARPSLMLDVVLRGLAAVDQIIDAERIAEEAAGGFYWLRVTDQSHLEPAQLDPAEYPETQVIGQYMRILSRRIENSANETERTRAEGALRLGVALLRGREVLA